MIAIEYTVMFYEVLMDCSYKLTESEVVSSMQLHGRGSNKALVALVIVGVALVSVCVLTEFKVSDFN